MSAYRTVVFATDLSERAHAVFPVVRALARGGRIVIVHVVEQVLFSAAEGASSGAGLPVFWPSDSRAHREQLTEQLSAAYPAQDLAQVDYLVRDGDPAEEILRAAEEAGADLVAVGTHGRRGVDRLLSGSVAETVLRRARRAVLVHHMPEHDLLQPGPIRVVVHPTDFSSASGEAVKVARALAREQGATLSLVHIAADANDPGTIDRHLETLRRQAESAGMEGRVDAGHIQGEAVPEILRIAAEGVGRVIVLGTHGRTGLGRSLLGSTALEVLRSALCPAIVVKPAADAFSA